MLSCNTRQEGSAVVALKDVVLDKVEPSLELFFFFVFMYGDFFVTN